MLYLTPKVFDGLDANTFGYLARIHDLWPTRMVKSGYWWAADNGMFTGAFSDDDVVIGKGNRKRPGWWTWLNMMLPHQATCLFVVVPDVIGDAAATLARWGQYAPRMRDMGYKCAYAVQDGQQYLPLPNDYDAMFVGGSTEFKMGPHAQDLAARCKADGKWLHVGRVNSRSRIDYCRRIQADSVDGTHPIYEPSKAIARITQWMTSPQKEMDL